MRIAARPALLLPALVFTLSAPAASLAPAAFVTDQSNDITSTASFTGPIRSNSPAAPGFDIGQTFTVGISGTLGLVSVRVGRTADTTAGLIFEIRSTVAGPSGGLAVPRPPASSVLGSVTLAASEVGVTFPNPGSGGSPGTPTTFGFASVDFSSFAIAANPGDVLAIVLRSTATTGGYYVPVTLPPADTYTRGTASSRVAGVAGSGNFGGAGGDLAFVTRVETGAAAVPEPASLAMLGVGFGMVGGGMAWARKRRSANRTA